MLNSFFFQIRTSFEKNLNFIRTLFNIPVEKCPLGYGFAFLLPSHELILFSFDEMAIFSSDEFSSWCPTNQNSAVLPIGYTRTNLQQIAGN